MVAVRIFFLCVLLSVSRPAQAQVLGDANCDGQLDVLDRMAAAQNVFAAPPCADADVNDDGRLSAADAIAVTDLLLFGTPTPTPTASPTMTATATPSLSPTRTATPSPSPSPTITGTPTQTLRPCADGAASLDLTIDNRSGQASITARLSGRLLQPSCANLVGASEYDVTTSAAGEHLDALAPGLWVHSIAVSDPPTLQSQHQSSLLLAAAANSVGFTAFASVGVVRRPNDGTGNNTFRDAWRAADAAVKPYLIQFDEAVFPPGVPTAMKLASALAPLAASEVTIDAIDSGGGAANRILDADGRANAVLTINGGDNTVRGLRLRNSGANNRDVVSISGPEASNNRIEQCIVEQSATGDAIGIDNEAGFDPIATANVVRQCEISTASDKGVKVTRNAYARVERSWLHHNANGGVQSTLSGHVTATDNLIEHNAGSTAQNGLSVNGVAPDTPMLPSELESEGNLVRFNGANGLSVRGLSVAVSNNDALVGNAKDGLRVANEGTPATALVSGSTMACNGANGAAIEPTSFVDFGGGRFGLSGNNAFTQNNLPGGAENLLNLTTAALYATNSQWEHCGRLAECDDTQIASYDLSDQGRLTVIAPSQAHRSNQAPAITSVRPSKGVAGDLVRVFGSGFNVIDAYAADSTCPDTATRNRCVPLHGNCVRIGNTPAPIEAVTPTMLIVRLPFTCAEAVPLTVTTQGGGTSAVAAFCTNAVP